MKQLLFLLVVLGCSDSFSQSKKDQIEALNLRVDSLMRVMQNERNLNTQKVSTLETKVNELNGELTNLQEQIRQEQEKIKVKDAEIGLLQAKLKLKTDSLGILEIELANLKLTPKIERTENLSEVVQNSNFKTVTIGTQVWMKENLNVSTFRNGDSIPEAKTDEDWEKAAENKQPAWCYYENNPKNGSNYGKLYNWYAVQDPRGLAPEGWHVPSFKEWEFLSKHLGDGENAEKKMKSNFGWFENGNGTNTSGFSGLPGGNRNGGMFEDIGNLGYWWSSSELLPDAAYYRLLSNRIEIFYRDYYNKGDGMSVRCVMD